MTLQHAISPLNETITGKATKTSGRMTMQTHAMAVLSRPYMSISLICILDRLKFKAVYNNRRQKYKATRPRSVGSDSNTYKYRLSNTVLYPYLQRKFLFMESSSLPDSVAGSKQLNKPSNLLPSKRCNSCLFRQLTILLSFVLMAPLFSPTAYSQSDPIAQLKFEDAEKAFNAGTYGTALDYIKETEKRVGVTSKTLYLKILCQDKILTTGAGAPDLATQLKTNVQSYLKAMEVANEGDIDDKYRNVYEISKRIAGYSSGKSGRSAAYSTAAGSGLSPGSRSSSASAASIIQAYKTAVSSALGAEGISRLQSIKIVTEARLNGTLTGSVTELKALNRKISISKFGVTETKLVFNNGKGYVESRGAKRPLTNQLATAKELSSAEQIFMSLYQFDQFSGALVSTGEFDGEAVNILTKGDKSYLFSKNTHLLMASQITLTNGNKATVRFRGYTNYAGIILPSTVISDLGSVLSINNVNSPTGSGHANGAYTSANNGSGSSSKDSWDHPDLFGELNGAAAGSGKSDSPESNSDRKASTKNVAVMGLFGSSLNTHNKRKQKDKNKESLSTSAVQNLVKAFTGATNQQKLVTQIISVEINIPVADADFE